MKKAAENGDLSQDELEEGEKEIEKDRQEIEKMRQGLKIDQQRIADDLKAEPQLQTQKFSGSDRNNKMFGENLNNDQPPSTPLSLG